MKITRENYEVFYLDLLEGNISNEDKLLLNEFLVQNPDLVEDDNDLIFLNDKMSSFENKNSLLQFDIAHDEINLNSIEFFLIAQKEGLLSDVKTKELNAFIAKDAILQNDQKYYALSTLNVDSAITYTEKSTLLQKDKVVLWPWITSAAAAIGILFFVNFNGNTEYPNATYAQQDLLIDSLEKLPTFDNSVQFNLSSQKSEELQIANSNTIIDRVVNSPEKNNVDVPNPSQKQERFVLANVSQPELKKLDRSVLPVFIENTPMELDENTVAAVTPSELNNPIRPVTDVIGKITGADVDYGVQKNVQKGNKFYLKIGKFEILRKS